MSKKIEQAIQILTDFGLPKAQQNIRTALCLLALLQVKKSSKWSNASIVHIGITPIMKFADDFYKIPYAPNTRETFRRFSMHQLVEAGIAILNPDEPNRSVNSPNTVYKISPEALEVIKNFGTKNFNKKLQEFQKLAESLTQKYRKERVMELVPITINKNTSVKLSPGLHSYLIKKIIEEFAPRFLHGAELLYVGDTGKKFAFFDKSKAEKIGFDVDEHGKIPDVVFSLPQKNWLILVESVTSHGPVDSKRHLELEKLFANIKIGKVFITAFNDKQTLAKYISEIAWETEVWVADNPTHMIHFNGDRFLGPHTK